MDSFLILKLEFICSSISDSMCAGDQILKVNSIELEGKTLEEALMIIKEQPPDITLTILPSEQATAHLG